jgi:thiol:disulfide interchange protein DsbA
MSFPQDRRSFLGNLLAVPALCALSGSLGLSALAHAAEGQSPDNTVILNPIQPTDSGPGKIEVLEFFSYGCSHCAHFNPLLEPWLKKLPADVVFKRVPVGFGRAPWLNLSKMHYALDSMGLGDKLAADIFDAIFKDHERLDLGLDRMTVWLGKKNVDTKQFTAAFNSFTVQSQVKRAETLTKNFKINGTPTLAIDGRYLVTADTGPDAMLTTASKLITRVRGEKGGKGK